MRIRRKLVSVIIVTGWVLMAGCRTSEPTATLEPPADAVTAHVTAISVPPTAAETHVRTASPTHVEDALQGSEGSGPRQSTENRAADLSPSWEPAAGSGLYLGQPPPGLAVELFAPGIVSIDEGKEYNIAISPDLQEIFFTRRTPGGRDDRLWVCRLENGKLTMPELAPFAYDSFETDPCFTPDGNRLYFNSWRPLPGEEAASARPNVWFVDKTEEGWSQPQFLGPPLNDYRPVYFSIANDGTLYFTRSSPRGIYYAEPEDGQYREAHRLPDEINYVRQVAHPAVAPDESYIIVDSAYEQGGRLVGSLYISFKRPDGSWTKAASLHDALRASESDVYASPRITPDGKYLFFEKYDQATDRADIYWVSADVVRELATDTPEPTTTSGRVATDPTSACPPARGAGTVPPVVAICSITFVVNGLEQVVRHGDMLQALPGDEVQVREVTVCAGSFSGNGGEACVDLVPVSQSGRELVSEHAGTHIVRVTPGCATISGPSHAWTVGENWREIAVVLNHQNAIQQHAVPTHRLVVRTHLTGPNPLDPNASCGIIATERLRWYLAPIEIGVANAERFAVGRFLH
jgi:hypothetical protein